MVNEEGIEAYKKDWTEVQAQITEGISCYTCHANTPGEITVTHTYWIDAVGEDFDKIAPANLACGQCHNEYYFEPETKATTIAHNSLESMAPETMLAYFNDGANFSTGEAFTDWTNPRTGVKMIKVQRYSTPSLRLISARAASTPPSSPARTATWPSRQPKTAL